jgi:hypothetical protein
MNKTILTALIFSLTITNSYAIKALTEKEIALEQAKELKHKEEYFKFHGQQGFDYGLLKQTYTKQELDAMLKNEPLSRN